MNNTNEHIIHILLIKLFTTQDYNCPLKLNIHNKDTVDQITSTLTIKIICIKL